MGELNYQHLYYFWAVAREGSVNAASRSMKVTASTVSVQIRKLEEEFEQKLFHRVGRGLQLTEVGRITFRFAESIFSTGRELEEFLQGQRDEGSMRLEIGVAPVLPKLVTWRLLEPATQMEEPCHVVCREESPSELVEDLLLHQLDVVISDVPLKAATGRLYNHLLGESYVSLFAAPDLVKRYQAGFPASLDRAPFVLPSAGTELRRSMDTWFSKNKIQPHVVAEFDDLALLKVAGEHSLGIIPIPDSVRDEAMRHYNVECLGTADGVVERFYVVSADRQIEHPAIVAIVSGAREFLEHEG